MPLYEILISNLSLVFLLLIAIFSIYNFIVVRKIRDGMGFIGKQFDELYEDAYRYEKKTTNEFMDLTSRISALEQSYESVLRIQYEHEQDMQNIFKRLDIHDNKKTSTAQLEHLPPKRAPGRPVRNQSKPV